MWPSLPPSLPPDDPKPLVVVSQKVDESDPASGIQVLRAEKQDGQSVKKFDGLEVTYDSYEFDFQTRKQVFSGKVTAKYGLTLLQADKLELDESAQTGKAEGSILLTDPEGFMRADQVSFRWRKKTDPEFGPNDQLGTASNATIRAGNAFIKAQRVTVFGDRWFLEVAEGALTQRQNPEWKFTAREVTLYPGSHGIAKKISLNILGVRIGPLPSYRFNLNPRFDSKLSLPSYSLNDDGRFGLSWSYKRLLTDKSVLSASWGAFPQSLPSYSVTYTLSELDLTQTSARLSVDGDMGERFANGYLDRIGVVEPDQEKASIRQRRKTWQIASQWNESPSGRVEEFFVITKPLEVIFEQGGKQGEFGWLNTSRIQMIRSQIGDNYRPRLTSSASLSLPDIALGRDLDWRTRLDLFSTLSTHTAYGFARGQAGLVWNPDKRFRLGAAYVLGGEVGKADFNWDRLYSRQALHWRADAALGPFKFSHLWKYDFDQGVIYDREYLASFVAGAFEPFIEYRQFPSSYQFGFRFRMDNLAERLTNRQIKR
jgi:hypothetical protein